MAKKVGKSDYGVYKIDGDNLVLKKGGFANTYECEKWVRAQAKKEGAGLEGEFAILSLRKKFTLQTKTTVTVKLIDSDAAAAVPSKPAASDE